MSGTERHRVTRDRAISETLGPSPSLGRRLALLSWLVTGCGWEENG